LEKEYLDKQAKERTSPADLKEKLDQAHHWRENDTWEWSS
jgi:hypothetical protein